MRISDWRSDVCSSDRRCSIRACAEAVMAGEPLAGRRRAFRAGGWASAGMIVGLAVTLALVAGALLSLLWTPYPVAVMDIPAQLQAPFPAHWLGTRSAGRRVGKEGVSLCRYRGSPRP